MSRLAFVILLFIGGSASAQDPEPGDGRESRLRVEVGLGSTLFNPAPILTAALQWRAEAVPLGFEVRLEPLQLLDARFTPISAQDHFVRLQLAGRLVSSTFETAIGLSGTHAGLYCTNSVPSGGGAEVEECDFALGLLASARVRFGDVTGTHAILRGEFPLLATRRHSPLEVSPSLGATANFAVTDRVQLLFDGEVRVIAYHLDAGARVHLGQPGRVGTVALVGRVGWYYQYFDRDQPIQFGGPRLIVGVEQAL